MLVECDNAFFVVADAEAVPEFGADTGLTGLLRVSPTSVSVIAGLWSGVVNVDFVILKSEPDLDLGAWEDAAEASLLNTSGRIAIGGSNGALVAYPHLGDLRMRVYSRGRDTKFDLVSAVPMEDYLIQVWPQTAETMRLLQSTSRAAKSWRASARSQVR